MSHDVPSSPPSRRSRYLVAVDGQPRVRRAADVTTVVVGLLLVGWGLLAFTHGDASEQTLASLIAALPSWVVSLLLFVYSLGLLYAVVLVVALAWGRRGTALRDVAVAGLLAGALSLTLTAIFDQLWPDILPELSDGPVRIQFPVLRVAVVAAILIVASPHLARPMRRLGWAVLLLTALAAAALGYGAPSGALGALGIAMVCAGGVLVAFGSPEGYPDVDAVAEGLAALGLPLDDLRVDPDQSWGVRRMVGTRADGVTVEVKALGRDATDSQFAAKAWHALAYRGSGEPLTFSRLQAVEHEALVTLLASRAGVRTPEVLAAATASGEVAVLATTRRGVRLADCDPAEVADEALVALWQDLARLHDCGITHGSLDTAAVRLADDGTVIEDFSAGSLRLSERQEQLDVVRLLFSLAALVGVERAVATAAEGFGAERLGRATAYLQVPALTTRERRQADKASHLLKELHARVVEVTGVDAPESVKLRRLGLRDVLMLVVLVLFVSAIIPVLAGVDYAELWSVLQNATWWIILAAVVLGQAAFVPQAFAMMFAVGRSIPLRPLTILQPAIAFISFAVPGVAGRVTMNAAFLYKYGVPPAVAVTQGGIDGFSGFLVQAVLLVIAFATGAITLTTAPQSTSSSSVPWEAVVIVVVGLAVVTVLAVWKVKRLHDRVVPVLASVWGALADLAKSPSRALGLFGSQLVVQVSWGLILWAALYAVGAELNLVACIAVVVATSLLQGVVPVPGGIGVSEAVMTAFLIPLGVSSSVAMAATVVWRVATFYLPATEGFFAAKWLEKHDYL